MSLSRFAAVLTSLLCAVAYSADDSVRLDRLTVTQTRLPLTDRALPDVTTIDRAAIEASNAPNVLTLLRSVGGLQVASPSGRSGLTEVFVRGGEPNFTVVLIDGVQVNDPSNPRGGSFDFGRIDVDQVERVEIFRGALSAVHGSDALSGLISITTRNVAGQNASTRVAAELGGSGSRRASASGSLRLGAGNLYLGAGGADDGDQVLGSLFESKFANVSYGAPIGDKVLLRASARFNQSDRRAFPEDSGGPRLAVVRDRETGEHHSTNLALDVRTTWDRSWQLSATTQLHRLNDTANSPGVAPGVRSGVPANGFDADFERVGQTIAATFSGPADTAWVIGAEYEREDARSRGFIDFGVTVPADFALRRSTGSVFVEAAVQPGPNTRASFGARYDNPDNHDDQTSLSAHLSQVLAGDVAVGFTYAEGFKLPSFFALASPLVGNPALRPESSRSVSVALTGTVADASWSVRLFRNRFNDLIDFDPDAFTNVNRARVETSGGDLELGWQPHARWRIKATLTHVDIDIAGGGNLRRRPRWQGSVAATYQPSDAWLLNALIYSQASAFDSSIPTGGLSLGPWQRLDLSARWQVSPDQRLWLSIDNVFDKKYEEAIGFPAPGIHPRLRFEQRW